MKKVVLLTVAVMCVSGLAFGQNVGSIDIFSDVGLTDCNIVAPPAGVFPVWIAQTNVGGGVTAVQFKLNTPATITSVGEIPSFQLTLGNTTTGVSISYSACKTGTFLLLQINYLAQGPTAACEWITVAPEPSDPGIQFIDCNDNTIFLPSAGEARVNPDISCTCNVPVQETTWGGIKALYQN
jgi:hypothetical protein